MQKEVSHVHSLFGTSETHIEVVCDGHTEYDIVEQDLNKTRYLRERGKPGREFSVFVCDSAHVCFFADEIDATVHKIRNSLRSTDDGA